MAEKIINLKVITPEKLVVEENVSSATFKSADGEVGILPDHTRYVCLLGNGPLSYDKIGGGKGNMLLAGGFCTFENNQLTLLADAVEIPNSGNLH